ncbi:cytochrome b [Ferrimonas gelatinilytica]|uniref:Cytochrome b/b6 domain-containing protein n=1 Tax=Ferrimonas gelatinilytica TaxID=1255257 RepID=A0ABP9RSV5_9GAMM
MWRNSTSSYGWISIALHWISALTVFGLFGVGLWMVELTYYSPWYQQAPALHKAVGLLLAATLVLRLLWRIVNPKPEAPRNHSIAERLGARLGHLALYGLMLGVLISGYLISTADGRGISLFGLLEVPALVSGLPEQAEIAGEIHFYLAWTLVLLAGLHGLAAIKHHLIDKDTTLRRMIAPLHSNRSTS